MSKNSFYKKRDYLPTNSSIQKLNDGAIEYFFLNNYKNYSISNEFKEIIKKNPEVFEEEPIKPDLVLKNKLFNKNICFIDAHQDEFNYFPRKIFSLKKLEKAENENEQKKEKEKDKNNIKSDISFIDNKLSFMNSLIISGIEDIKPYVSGGTNNEDKKRDDIIYLISSFMNNKGWNILFNDGKIKRFTSFELFEFLTEEILEKNIKLDNMIIWTSTSTEKLKGGYLYLYLQEYLPLFMNSKNN